MKSNLAYIDDHKENLDCLSIVFGNDYEMETFLSPEEFIQKFPTSNFAAILVDIHMPLMDGYKLYETIIQHNNYNGCPIIFVSSDDSDSARIKSFTLGAVDFLPRNMKPEEMIARVTSKIQFYQKHRNIVDFGNLKVNHTLLKAYLGNDELRLTFIEFKLLCHALRRYPEIIPKDELVDHVWNEGLVLDATIYTHISNLNGKLSGWEYELSTIRGKGLKMDKKR